MYQRVRLKCDGCSTAFTCAPEQAGRSLGRLCGNCLSKLPWIQPPGYSKPPTEEITEERDRRRADFRPPPECVVIDDPGRAPAAPPLRDANGHAQRLQEIMQLLSAAGGLQCLPRFLKHQIWRVVQSEPETVLAAYRRDHLGLLATFVEPLAGAGRDPQFGALCQELEQAPGSEYLALRFGCSPPDDSTDVAIWLTWAVEKQDAPAVCLYCAAGFLAVPPYLGEPPVAVSATVHGLIARSLLGLGQASKAAQVAEQFLRLVPDDYAGPQTIRAALDRPPLGQLDAMLLLHLVDTLASALERSLDPGSSKAAALQSVLRERGPVAKTLSGTL